MCVCLPYATTEGIFYAYKILYLDNKQLGYFKKKEKSGFDDPKSAYEDAIRYCLENLIDQDEQKTETINNKNTIIITNTKTEKQFEVNSIKIDRHDTIPFHDPTVTITLDDYHKAIPTIGKKIADKEIITKKEAIGDNEKLHVAHYKNDIMIYEYFIYNAWIKDIDTVSDTIILQCDYISI